MPTIEPQMPRMPEPIRPKTHPVEKVALTKSLGAASQHGVVVMLSPEVEWMRKNGIL
jgi:hypothetical protein